MNENLLCCATVYLILLISSVHCNENENEAGTKKTRGSSGLISMPRVGRSDLMWAFQAPDDTDPNLKNKRGTSGLLSFPRTGRSDLMWALQRSDMHEVKRQGLIAFPRVGRGGSGSTNDGMALLLPSALLTPAAADAYMDEDGSMVMKRASSGVGGESSGMWFGPRLGKRGKRGIEFPWAVVTVKEFPGGRRYGGFTPRLGRESAETEEEELMEDDEVPAHIHGLRRTRSTSIHKGHNRP